MEDLAIFSCNKRLYIRRDRGTCYSEERFKIVVCDTSSAFTFDIFHPGKHLFAYICASEKRAQ